MQNKETSLQQRFPPGANVRAQQLRYFLTQKWEER